MPGLISSSSGRELEGRRRHDVQRDRGQVENTVRPAELCLGLKHDGRCSQGRRHRGGYRDLSLAPLSAMLALGTARPGGSGNAVIARAASAPFVRTTFTGIVAPKPWGTSIGVAGVSSVTGSARAGAATSP